MQAEQRSPCDSTGIRKGFMKSGSLYLRESRCLAGIDRVQKSHVERFFLDDRMCFKRISQSDNKTKPDAALYKADTELQKMAA